MINSYIESKKIVMDFYDEIHINSLDTIDNLVNKYYADDVVWHGPQPFNTLTSSKKLVSEFWKPIMTAIPDLKKTAFMHLAGSNYFGGHKEWVVSSGHYSGCFKNDIHNIPATDGMVWVTYIEFNRVENKKIVETYTIIDMLDLIRQAGINIVKALAPEVIIPGPTTCDGVIMDNRDKKETQKTFQLIFDMIYKGLMTYEDVGMGNMGLGDYFSQDFTWLGPCGIGTTKGIDGFEKYHQRPFLDSVPDRTCEDDKFRITFAEGNYGALIEWEGFTATHTGDGWLGQSATGKKITMRDADLYLRVNDKLTENWCYMDVIDVLLQMGVDVFEKLKNKDY